MWGLYTVKKHRDASGLAKEYSYASHHHLIPLYVLGGITLLVLIVVGCYVSILWQSYQRDVNRDTAFASVENVENLYISTDISPSEKKQYVYSANVRFATSDPYNNLRYQYDPGINGSKTSSTLTFTTTPTLRSLSIAVENNPARLPVTLPRLQECSRLYVVRFEPGVTTYGGFAPLKDIKLKDGRTAYIHKNTNCVPQSTQAMNQLEEIEKTILSIESY
jgi:hypothetical protein